MSRRWTQLAVLLPVIALSGMIAEAELALRAGPSFRLRLAGYDPRDLLHGRYLQYRFELNWQGPHSCGQEPNGDVELYGACCLCLTHDGELGFDPPVAQVYCEEIKPGRCDGVLRSGSIEGARRYFIPEENAAELDNRLAVGDFALELTCGLDRDPAIRELLIGGVPWREALKRSAARAE
jgi:hypothetical protein